MECFQNVGMAAEKAGNEESEEHDDKGQEEYESKRDVLFDSAD
jgi:hypothetical protein